MNANIQAVEDRAIIVDFRPSVGEVHVQVREWFNDREVYDFIEDHLAYIAEPSMRHYIKGSQLKKACPESWQEKLLTVMGIDGVRRCMIQLLNDASFGSESERVPAFQAQGLGDRATYYRWKKKLNAAG